MSRYEIRAYESKIKYIYTLENEGRGEESIIKKPKNFTKAIESMGNNSVSTFNLIAKKSIKQRRKKVNHPKRFRTNYVYFTNENRERIKSEHQNTHFKEIGIILGEKWKQLTKEERKVKMKFNRRFMMILQLPIKFVMRKKWKNTEHQLLMMM